MSHPPKRGSEELCLLWALQGRGWDVLKILSLPVHEYIISLHLFRYSLSPLSNIY